MPATCERPVRTFKILGAQKRVVNIGAIYRSTAVAVVGSPRFSVCYSAEVTRIRSFFGIGASKVAQWRFGEFVGGSDGMCSATPVCHREDKVITTVMTRQTVLPAYLLRRLVVTTHATSSILQFAQGIPSATLHRTLRARQDKHALEARFLFGLPWCASANSELLAARCGCGGETAG